MTDGWMETEMWYTHAMQYYSVLKKKQRNPAIFNNMSEIRRHYAKWNKYQSQKDRYCMIPRMWGIQNSRRKENICQGVEDGWNEELLVNNYKVSIEQDE